MTKNPRMLAAEWRSLRMKRTADEMADLLDEFAPLLDQLATQGCGLLVIERHRQITEEGWTPNHDDQHDDGVLVRAALCYADKAAVQIHDGIRGAGTIRPAWPWDAAWWKPSDDPIRNLVKAGALIAAEIDRLQRAEVSA